MIDFGAGFCSLLAIIEDKREPRQNKKEGRQEECKLIDGVAEVAV